MTMYMYLTILFIFVVIGTIITDSPEGKIIATTVSIMYLIPLMMVSLMISILLIPVNIINKIIKKI